MQLYDFQIEYLKDIPRKYIFAAATGTGKTILALAHYEKYAAGKPLLILAPASKVRTNDWPRELANYFGDNMPDYTIYSYEKFSRNPTLKQFKETGAMGLWRDWLKVHPNGFAFIADEVAKAKNPQSGIGKRVFEVATRADTFAGLSATPTPNGFIDMANYYKIFGYVKGITEFKQRYCHIETYKGWPEIIGYWHEDELKQRWNKIAKPLSKEDALDLPPIVQVPVSLASSPAYLQIQRRRAVDDELLDNASALLHAMRQSLIEPKLKWLDDFLDDTSENTVIFYNYISERKAILELLKKKYPNRRIFRQDGEVHNLPERGEWQDLDRSITLAQYLSASTGIELTYASCIVYLSPTYSYMNFQQSIGRIERIGQARHMTLYLLSAPTTVEKSIWQALRNKKDFSEKVWYDNLTTKKY